jgi:hypothetical protein
MEEGAWLSVVPQRSEPHQPRNSDCSFELSMRLRIAELKAARWNSSTPHARFAKRASGALHNGVRALRSATIEQPDRSISDGERRSSKAPRAAINLLRKPYRRISRQIVVRTPFLRYDEQAWSRVSANARISGRSGRSRELMV